MASCPVLMPSFSSSIQPVFSPNRLRSFDLLCESRHLIFQRRLFQHLLQHRMFSRDHDRRRAVYRVDARGKDANLFVVVLNFEIDVSAFAATDPIALPFQNLLRPAAFDFLDVCDQLLSVFGGAQIPLFNLLLGDR